MEELQLVIPTHARPYRQTTLMQLPAKLRRNCLVVTSTTNDADTIASVYEHKNIAIAKDTTCIAEKRHWIMKNVKAKYIFMMDDDMTFFQRCPPQQRKYGKNGWEMAHTPTLNHFLNGAVEKDFATAFAAITTKFRSGHAAVGLSSRMGNNRMVETWAINTRLMHAFGINSAVYHRLKLNFGEVKCREDFNIALRLLRAGYFNGVYFDLCCSPGSYDAAGGASTERTLEQSNAQAHYLATLHPKFVKVVERKYKTSLQRMEVIIAWKKAAQAGQVSLGK